MSDERAREPNKKTHASTGAGWKWLTGAAVAAVLLGGGYYAWRNFGPTQSGTEVAADGLSSTQTSATPTQAGPLATSQAAEEIAPSNSGLRSTATPEIQTVAGSPAQRRATQRPATPAPEQTVGVFPASATTEDSEPIIVQAAPRPVWRYAPSARRLATIYPERALEDGREGEASVHCTVRSSGALDCIRVSETPANVGFGEAALRATHMFRHAVQRADGSDAIGSPVNLRVVFRMADNDRRG